MTKGMKWRKSTFEIDGMGRFEGYTLGNTWNGWECPYFTKDISFEIMKSVNAVSGDQGPKLHYDADADAFVYSHPDFPGEDDVYKGQDVQIEGKTLRLYPIGAGFWMWTECVPV